MTRPARFVGEYALAAAAGGVVAAAISAGSTLTTPYGVLQAKSWLTQLTQLYLEWLVMRRYFGWASQWALASLAGSLLVGVAAPFVGSLRPIVGPRLWWIPGSMLGAVPQAVVLSTRARQAWLWPVFVAVFWVGRQVLGELLVPASSPGTMMGGALVSRAITVASSVAGAVVIAWMCRDELACTTERPPASTATRLEFLIGWVAVHVAVIAVTGATPAPSGGPMGHVQTALIVYAVTYLAGIALVLSTTKEDWKAWLFVPTLVAGIWVVASVTPVFFIGYYGLLLTKWTALGFTLALGQWFAVRRWSWGAWWLAAAALGWSASVWIPRGLAAAVGPGQLYRFPIAEPMGIYAVVGLISGVAVVAELRRGDVFAR